MLIEGYSHWDAEGQVVEHHRGVENQGGRDRVTRYLEEFDVVDHGVESDHDERDADDVDPFVAEWEWEYMRLWW